MASDQEKIRIVLLDIPEAFQISIFDAISRSFPDISFDIAMNSKDIKGKSIVFSLWSVGQFDGEKFRGLPLFLMVNPEDHEGMPVLRFSEEHPVFDYWITIDSQEFLKNRIVLFVKKSLEHFRNAIAKHSAEKYMGFPSIVLEKLRGFLYMLFKPRAISTKVEFSPIIANKWLKVKRLGFGSFGEAWLVQRKGTITDDFAVAKIPHDIKSNPKFIQEAEILKKLEGHPNAIRLIEMLEQGDKVIIIEEFVDGETLQEYMDRGMTSVQKESFFLQILDMVAYAHDLNIMHRDLKPENILVNSRGIIKVLDFGTAKDVSRRSISSTVIGSRPYMSPEQILGESRIASDVWALGILLYAISTDYVPFYSENEKELMDMILESPPEPPRMHNPSLPNQLEELILKCLEKDWKKRFPNGRALQKALLKSFPNFGTGGFIA